MLAVHPPSRQPRLGNPRCQPNCAARRGSLPAICQGRPPDRPLLARRDDLSAEALRCLWSVLQGGEVSRQINDAARRVLCQQHAERLQAMASRAQQQQQVQQQQQEQQQVHQAGS